MSVCIYRDSTNRQETINDTIEYDNLQSSDAHQQRDFCDIIIDHIVEEQRKEEENHLSKISKIVSKSMDRINDEELKITWHHLDKNYAIKPLDKSESVEKWHRKRSTTIAAGDCRRRRLSSTSAKYGESEVANSQSGDQE